MRQLIRKILHETIKDKDESAKFIKCRECKKKFTQTIHKGKKSLPICPHCGAHNTEKRNSDEIREELTSDKKNMARRYMVSLSDEIPKIVNLFYDGYVSSRSFCKSFPNYGPFLGAVKNVMFTKIVGQLPKNADTEGVFEYAGEIIERLYGEYIKKNYDNWCNKPKRKTVKEGFTDLLLKKLRKYPFKEYQKSVDKFMNLQKLKVKENQGALKEIHLEKPSGEVVIKVKNSITEGGNVIYISWRLMNELESYISSPGLVVCVSKWIEKNLKLDNVKKWEIFLD